ncbi:hypothetical protein, partial [Flavobacterium sp.]|uniref:hypothetical protein n=1 Tax=Flavobacterium sp. TaxID=239 RepID=UPI0037BF8F21
MRQILRLTETQAQNLTKPTSASVVYKLTELVSLASLIQKKIMDEYVCDTQSTCQNEGKFTVLHLHSELCCKLDERALYNEFKFDAVKIPGQDMIELIYQDRTGKTINAVALALSFNKAIIEAYQDGWKHQLVWKKETGEYVLIKSLNDFNNWLNIQAKITYSKDQTLYNNREPDVSTVELTKPTDRKNKTPLTIKELKSLIDKAATLSIFPIVVPKYTLRIKREESGNVILYHISKTGKPMNLTAVRLSFEETLIKEQFMTDAGDWCDITDNKDRLSIEKEGDRK